MERLVFDYLKQIIIAGGILSAVQYGMSMWFVRSASDLPPYIWQSPTPFPTEVPRPTATRFGAIYPYYPPRTIREMELETPIVTPTYTPGLSAPNPYRTPRPLP